MLNKKKLLIILLCAVVFFPAGCARENVEKISSAGEKDYKENLSAEEKEKESEKESDSENSHKTNAEVFLDGIFEYRSITNNSLKLTPYRNYSVKDFYKVSEGDVSGEKVETYELYKSVFSDGVDIFVLKSAEDETIKQLRYGLDLKNADTERVGLFGCLVGLFWGTHYGDNEIPEELAQILWGIFDQNTIEKEEEEVLLIDGAIWRIVKENEYITIYITVTDDYEIERQYNEIVQW